VPSCIQVEVENWELREKLKQLLSIRDKQKIYIDKLLRQLVVVDTMHRLEQKTTSALRQQVNAYREDLEGEHLDRHRAQERLVKVEHQLHELRHQVHTHTHTHTHTHCQCQFDYLLFVNSV